MLEQPASDPFPADANGFAEAGNPDFGTHMKAIAHARYVLRHVMRLLDEQAEEGGLQPLQHQALLQMYGAGRPLPVSKVADRLGIAPALASRIVRRLEELGLVERVRGFNDRRVIAVLASEVGIAKLREIDANVQRRIGEFRNRLDREGKYGALATFAFYVGLDTDTELQAFLRRSGAPLH
ncbi:MAG: MarR family winged helix-turn-helix transcriptional regulator [Acidimicrobiales bacterium]